MTRAIAAELFASASEAQALKSHEQFEFAIVGRSNVGKSTFINRICGRKSLVRVSQTPGRTQEVNLFSVILRDESPPDRKIIVADLPGYGFAKVSKKKRDVLSNLIHQYLTQRTELKLVCLLVDPRRDIEDEEFAVRELVAERNVHFLVVLTKADKLKRQEEATRVRVIADQLGLEPEDMLTSGEGRSVDTFWQRITLLAEAL